MVSRSAGRLPDKKAEIEQAARWAAYFENQGTDDYLLTFFYAEKGGEIVANFLMQTYTVALPVVLGYIVWILKRQKCDRDANSTGTMLLLRVQMIEYHDKYMRLGEIPSYAYENFMEMYDAYHSLGGNGMVTKMKNEIEELHLKQKER